MNPTVTKTMKITKTTAVLLLAVLLFPSFYQKAEAIEVLIEGSFSASAFTQGGAAYPVTPDPLNLSFSVVVTVDDASFASNEFFQIDSVADSISPAPLTVGTETFTADQVGVRVYRTEGSEVDPGVHGIGVVVGIGEFNGISARTNDFNASFGALIDASESTAPQTLTLSDVVRLVNEPINGGIQSSSIQSGSVTLTLVPEPSPPSLSGFTYDPSTNQFDVSLKGAANTAYILVEADDLDFTNPGQSPIPLAGASASVGSLDGHSIVTDGSGNATVENVSLGGTAKDATFIRAETP